MQKLTAIVTLIREAGNIEAGVLAVKLGLAPVTLASYKQALLAVFHDVKFEKGVYTWIHPYECATAQELSSGLHGPIDDSIHEEISKGNEGEA